MSAIANQWTGDGLADGTVITSGNVNTAGNGSSVAFSTSGSATITTEGHGFRVKDAASAGIRRLDASISGSCARVQMRVTPGEFPTATVIVVRNPSASQVNLLVNGDGSIQISANGVIAASKSPVPAVGDTLLVDLVAALHSAPTTSNGRVFFRVRNLTNTSWANGGEFFYDSGYTLNLGTDNFSSIRFGKMSTETLGSTGILYEYPGWEAITVSTADTSVAAAKAYFADAPVDTTPLATPVVTVTGKKDPAAGASDGTVTVTWPAVSGAHHYEAGIASGDVTSGFTTVSTSATSPFTFTGLSGGLKTVAIKAKASA